MDDNIIQFEPDWYIAPGEILAEALEERGMTLAEFARQTSYATEHINKIIKAEAPISHEAAIRFEHVLGIPSKFWLNFENDFRLSQKKRKKKT